MDVIYLDNNASTRIDPAVVAAMRPYLEECYGNPSSIHRLGQLARQAIDESRTKLARLIGCSDSEVTFTGGGTEAINTVLRGLLAARSPRTQIVTSMVEHSATRELCRQLEKAGSQVTWIGVDRDGMLDMEMLRRAIGPETALATFLWANNETGVIFPVAQIAAICQEHKVPFHCDATQAMGKIPIDARAAGFDAMSFAAHKFHGPKGVGGYYLRRRVRIGGLIVGGPQEHSRRGGTENVPGIVGAAAAAELAAAHLAEIPRVAAMRDKLERAILDRIPETRVNGRVDQRIANTTNIGFRHLEAEAVLLLLSERGVCASAGSACSSGSLEPSHVLRAMGVDETYAHGSLRFSLSRYTTEAELDTAVEILSGAIAKLRQVLPVGR
jgi:cysteine desulfurase